MASSRDQRLAEKLRARQGNNYESASDRARRQSAEASSVSSTPDTSDPAATYDQVRATPDSRERRARSRTRESLNHWRRNVADHWNR